MRYDSIKEHLKPYRIMGRKSTITHAFASAIAPHDSYDAGRTQEALRLLGQDPDGALLCAYCHGLAQTWDHIFATTRARQFSGYGHRLGNLLPCCKNCNSSKRNSGWEDFLLSLNLPKDTLDKRRASIGRYIAEYAVIDRIPTASPDFHHLQMMLSEILVLMSEADKVAASIRLSEQSERT